MWKFAQEKKRLNSSTKIVTNKNPTPSLPLNPHKNKQIGGIEELIKAIWRAPHCIFKSNGPSAQYVTLQSKIVWVKVKHVGLAQQSRFTPSIFTYFAEASKRHNTAYTCYIRV
jgi:hypothetical protein